MLERLPKSHDEYTLLGTAAGLDIRHCAEIAARHCDNFIQRACAFELTNSKLGEALKQATKNNQYISVNFYEKQSRP